MEPECSCSSSEDDTSYESDDDDSPPRRRRRRRQQQRRKLKGKLGPRRGRPPGRQRLVYSDCSTSSSSDEGTPPRQPSRVHWSLPRRKTHSYASMNCLRYSSQREQSCRSRSSNGLSIGRRRSLGHSAGDLWCSDDDEAPTRFSYKDEDLVAASRDRSNLLQSRSPRELSTSTSVNHNNVIIERVLLKHQGHKTEI